MPGNDPNCEGMVTQMSIVVTTPTGNIGSGVARRLLDAGESVTLLARSPERLDADVRGRAVVKQGDLTDAAFVAAATEGAEAVFWLTPSDIAAPDARAWYEALAVSARAAGQRSARVVNLSSAGAHRPAGAGPVSLLQIVENALNETGAAVTHLRPGYFFENYLEQAGGIAQAGSVFLPVPEDCALPMVATRDIAEVAAARLRDRSWRGVSYRGLHGPRTLTFGEAAAEISAALGRPVRHVTIDADQARDVFLSLGASPDFAQRYLEMFAAFAALPGEAIAAEPRTAETTTPTTLRAWASEILKPAVESAGTAA